MVEMMAAYRIAEDEMVKLIINPQTGAPITRVTLRKHFRKEIDTGFLQGKMRIMAASFRSALGETKQNADGTVEVTKDGNVTAQIWLQKTLYGAREKMDVELPTVSTDPESNEVTFDQARRIAFSLAMGARAKQAMAKAKGGKKKAKEPA